MTENSRRLWRCRLVLCAATLAGSACAINRPPVASAGRDQVVDGGALVTLDGSASRDPEGRPLSFSWRQTLGPSVALSSSSAPVVTLTAPTTGTTLAFSLTVSDGERHSSTKVRLSVHALDRSAHVDETPGRSVFEDPAVSGKVDPGFTRVRHPKTPPQPPDGDDEGGAFQDLENVRFATPLEGRLDAGATRQVELQVTGASALLGSVRWEGTASPLPATLSFEGSPVATGDTHRLDTNRGATTLQARTAAGGRATLSVTNSSGVPVTVKVTLGALPF
jgi:hypothetical protein